ncbi:MAG: GTPase HflX [Eubacteriales bacterium]
MAEKHFPPSGGGERGGGQAVLVAVKTPEMTDESVMESLSELERLLETAGGNAVLKVTQARENPDKRTYIGKGKSEEIADFIKSEGGVSLVVFNDELTPSQIKNLENLLGVRVIDRTMLILDIFALRASTAEGKLQVEIACLRYTSPRLTGHGREMSRLGGGIGTRGPGESKLETDRRHIRQRIGLLNEKLLKLEKSREIMRKGRESSLLPTVAIAGYTNAGKSTLLNYLTQAGVLAEDKLFATLDPTTRVINLPGGLEALLTDTVGFIDRLPTHLIKAFRSTLDELKYADAVVCLVDSSEPDAERSRKRSVTEKLVKEIAGGDKSVVWCYNKRDKEIDVDFIPPDAVRVSSVTGEGMDELLVKIKDALKKDRVSLNFFFPHSKAAEMYGLLQRAAVKTKETTDEGVFISAECPKEFAGRYKAFVSNNLKKPD